MGLQEDFASAGFRDSGLRIHNDLNHGGDLGPHFDVMRELPEIEGLRTIEKLRISANGDLLSSGLQIGKHRLD